MDNCDSKEFSDVGYECTPEDNKQLRIRIREHIDPCSSSSLKHWPILALQSEEFLSSIRMAYVYGAKANSVLVVTDANKIYAIGDNLFGCVGNQKDPCFVPRLVSDLNNENIKTFVSHKDGYVLALSFNGALYYGNRQFIQINSAPQRYQTSAQVQAHSPIQNITMVACTQGVNSHFLTVSKDGTMHQWTTDSSSNTPTSSAIKRFDGADEIVQIAAIHSTYIILLKTGEVDWYKGDKPIRIKYPEHIEKIACGYDTLLALSDMGHIYGSADTRLVETLKKPKLVELEHALDITANNWCHLYTATLLNGKIFMWGNCDSIDVTMPICSPFTSVEETFAKFAAPRIMPAPLNIKHAEVQLSIADCFAREFDNPHTSDFIIKIGEKCIYVHKLILALRSDFFRRMFENDWKETKNGIMDHEEFSYDVYRVYLKYLYTDTIDLSTDTAMDLVPVAQFYNDSRLGNTCLKILSNGLTVSDAMIIYDFARRHNLKELEDVCVNFAIHNMTNVVQSPAFAQLHPKVIINLLVTFAKAGCFKT